MLANRYIEYYLLIVSQPCEISRSINFDNVAVVVQNNLWFEFFFKVTSLKFSNWFEFFKLVRNF